MQGRNTLEIGTEITVDNFLAKNDSSRLTTGAYTKPYDGGFNLRYNENQELFEYVCQQANYAYELMVGVESDY